ncbi:hypothetical protein Ancab_028489, partial [Ancistrocladus abbreviatus]
KSKTHMVLAPEALRKRKQMVETDARIQAFIGRETTDPVQIAVSKTTSWLRKYKAASGLVVPLIGGGRKHFHLSLHH